MILEDKIIPICIDNEKNKHIQLPTFINNCIKFFIEYRELLKNNIIFMYLYPSEQDREDFDFDLNTITKYNTLKLNYI